MHPHFFGDVKKPLFGVYHPPASARPNDNGVLMCYPIAQEYLRAHHAFRDLARLLSGRGFHVLRFDYFATGDSAGEGPEATVEQWTADIRAAVDELKELASSRTISLVGMRFGATLAALSARGELDIEDFVLWDPVVSAEDYLGELRSLDDDLHEYLRRVVALDEGDRNFSELVGFPFPPTMRASIARSASLLTIPWTAHRVLLLISQERPEYQLLHDLISKQNVAVVRRCLEDDAEWDRFEKIDSLLLASDAVKTITEFLCEMK